MKVLEMRVLGLVAVFCLSSAIARRQAPPLGAEETVRKSNRAAECQHGREVRELGSTWFADLGPPFGIMYCIRCQCTPFQKKKRVVGRVQCRNIKHECPQLSCDEPVMMPGKCCKVCPSDVQNKDIPQDVAPALPPEEEDMNFKYYASLMTGHETATGRYSFHKKSLFYSFYATSRPQVIQFLDTNGNILEEQELGPGSIYQNATEKICGVWRRIPREYRRLIREEKLVISLLWPDKRSITGQLHRYRALSTEMFSSLMQGDEIGMAGTAIVSVSTSTPSIHITVVFTGLFDKNDSNDTPVSLSLYGQDGQKVLNEVIRIDKASPELNTIEISSAVSSSELRLLSKNKLSLAIKSKDKEIKGNVRVRAVCETFQCLMTNSEKNLKSSGLAWIYVDKNGRLNYHIKIDRVTRPVVIGLVTERKLVELEDLSPELTLNGWTNGTLDPLSPKYLEMFYAGDLGVNVATQFSESVIRGRLTGKYVASPVDSKAPLLLTDQSTEHSHDGLAALAWLDVDIECNLHYEVQVTRDGEYGLYLAQLPMDVPGAPVTRKILDEGQNHIEGSSLGLLPSELATLANGVTYVEINSQASGQILLKAQWTQIEVPEACLPNLSDNELHFNSDASRHKNLPPGSPCLQGGRFHEDGSQWRSVEEPCTICYCSSGKLICEPVICPELSPNCPAVQPPGQKECCPQCLNGTALESVSDSKGCQMAGQHFTPGSSWHPYLPPTGFDTCTTCTCHPGTLRVSCPRKQCPPLNCDMRVAVKPDRKACCLVCPSSIFGTMADGVQKRNNDDQRSEEASDAEMAAEILANGGCKYPVGGPYPNGQEWHPRLYSHGEMKCVKCKCKDGKVKCERKRCTKLSCNDECCAAQCKRRRRNIRRHH
ncbi:dorsal-ventral patterning protein Sog [Cimex lectularius]|uniref:Short gastrulation n=1 Tax=Cimex lectularius TaxID=79782 RepID=A0A8I6RAE3_CIMLE|nr:dorsal-ventral patterning protein Sog [Cimex lectularius]